MNEEQAQPAGAVPPRLRPLSPSTLALAILTTALVVHGTVALDLRPERIIRGVPAVGAFLSRAVPPDATRLPQIVAATLETLEVAIIGTFIGSLAGVPAALLAARNTAPNVPTYMVARALVSLLRSIPELVWALIFVITVGLGPLAGVCAIAVDAVGFCGRFFAERIEEVDPAPVRSLQAAGASRGGIAAGAIFPAVLPSFVATTLFALEGATRSAVVLGLVGAGGVGVELVTAMQLFRYDQALTVILVILAIVLAVERTSAAIRGRVI